jgi:hypothetical protein
MDPVDMVMELAVVDRETAVAALAQHKEVWVAVDALLTKPMSAGDRFLPAPPVVDDGLTPEQRELCRRGRWLQDQVNVVFSVAHSKTRTPLGQDSQADEVQAPPVELPLHRGQEPPLPLMNGSEQDSPERMTQQGQQSVTPQ